MTGMYQTRIGAHQHRTVDLKPLPDPVRVVAEYFRSAGYFTANGRAGNWKKRGKNDFNFKTNDPFEGSDWRQRKAGQPFFALAQFSETHRDFKRDPERPVDPARVTLPPYYPDHPLARRDWADYLECIQVLDRKVGEVLQRLEADGLADNTLVFFFGDHGRPHVRGKQWLYEGGIRVPLIARRPGRLPLGKVEDRLVSLIDLSAASLTAAGIPLPDHLDGQDFLAEGARKRTFIAAARDRCDETFDRIRCVRTERYKYIRNFYPHLPYTQPNAYKLRQYPMVSLLAMLHGQGKLDAAQRRFMAPGRPAEELYDLTEDPHELKNLAGSKAHADVMKAHRELLTRWIEKTEDQGEIPEDPGVAARCYLTRHGKRTMEVMRERGLPEDASPADHVAWWERKMKIVTGAIFRDEK